MWARGIAGLLIVAGLVWIVTRPPRAKVAPQVEVEPEAIAPAPVAPEPKSAQVEAKAPATKTSSPEVTVGAPEDEVPPAVTGSTRTLPPPKNEAGRDKTLAAFFVQLKDVLKRKDREALLTMLAPDIDVGMREMLGPNAFFTAWGLRDGDASVYAVITQILSLNGVWVGEQFCGPYVSVQFPPDLDRGKHHVVLNPDVRLRATASPTGRVLATLAYDIVVVLERGPEWTKVKTASGVEGYVPIAYLYSPAGYRACFSKNAEGAWKIQSLAVGR